jgi:hypothetical protein
MMLSMDSRILASGRPRAARLTAAVALAFTFASCVSSDATNGLSDKNPPTVSLSPGAVTDSTMTFTISATDNLGLLHVDAVAGSQAGGLAAACDTTFNSAVTTFSRLCTIGVPATVPIGTQVTILGQSVDGAHNISRVDTLLMVTGGGSPSIVKFTAPKTGDSAVVGSSIAMSISGKSGLKVKTLGWIVQQASGTYAPAKRDSVVFNSPLKDSTGVDSSISFVGAVAGPATLTPFMYDSIGTLYLGPPVNINVLATGGANTIPVVDFGITKRIETTDTIHVTAKDLNNIKVIGYKITTMPPASALVQTDSVIIAGNFSSVIHTFTMSLPVAVFPQSVRVMAFATNGNGRQDSARIPVGTTGFVRFDTVTVVAGLTRPLPNGGLVADGIYHPPTNAIYLTNITRNELEVFSLNDSTFHPAIPVGFQPWGIAARPLDHGAGGNPGAMSDTLLVALSGATHISYVDVASGTEVKRYALPNIVAYKVTSTLNANGQIVETRTVYDFSDRPQYLAATCKGIGACGDVLLAYSTTPTPGQTLPFPNQGTIRWEDLTTQTSHFFFEQSIGELGNGSIDTLEIERFPSSGYGAHVFLVPFRQGPFITGPDTSFFSIQFRVGALGFRDTTFTRNSGDFAHAIFGEGGQIGGGGNLSNARALTYDVNPGLIPTFVGKGHVYVLPVPVIDAGISAPTDVIDFIANTATRVSGVAVNLDGLTNAIRADSTYMVNATLRLTGMLQTSGGNAGLDFHPKNFGEPRPGATGGTQMMFSSATQPQIEVYNTNNGQRCMIVPTRDPVIGPIKSALLAGGNTVVVGATQFGVVIITIPQAQMAAACP